MRKIYLLLIAVTFGMLAQAQTYFWKDGQLVYATDACDIRFSKVLKENFQSVNTVVEMNNSLYWLFGQDKSYRNRLACAYQGYNTDIEHNVKNSGAAEYAIYSITTSNPDLAVTNGKDPWNYLARLIHNATIIVDGITMYCDTTNSAFAYILGEALFLRAFARSEMVKLWGDVPMEWKASYNVMSAGQPKQDRNLIYESIRADLKRAANLLPWANQIPEFDRSEATYRDPGLEKASVETYMEHPSKYRNYTGAPNKAAALALLARIDLNYAGFAMRPNRLGVPTDGYCIQLNLTDAEKRRALYQEALEACAKIIKQEGSFKLLSDFAQVFRNVCADVTDYTQSEIIWEIPFADGVRGQYLQYNCPKSSDALQGLKNNTSGASNSAIAAVPTLFYDYESKDVRRDVTIAPFAWTYDNGDRFSTDDERVQRAFPDVNKNEKFLYPRLISADSWYFGKCRVEWMSRNRMGNDDGVNVPIIRYADVLLMFCEAALGGITNDVPENNTGLAPQTQFDAIRSRAHVASKTLTMDNLMEERKLEFAGEAIRKYDLIRWGKLRSVMEAARIRLDNLDQHKGEFSNTSDTIYFKYKYIGSELSYSPDIKGYVLESMSHTRPANFNPEEGWCKRSVYDSDGDRRLSRDIYILYDYDHPEHVDSRQLWPVFLPDMGTNEKGYLWNDYDY